MRWKVSHIQIGADLCRKYKESAIVINAVESHHGDVEPDSSDCMYRTGGRYHFSSKTRCKKRNIGNIYKQIETVRGYYQTQFKGVDKSFAIQAGREIRIMVVPEQVSDADMVLLARDISKQIEAELEYPGQIKVNVIRESRATDYAK